MKLRDYADTMRWPIHNSLRDQANGRTPVVQAFLTGCRSLGAQVRSWAKSGQRTARREAGDWSLRLTDEKESLLGLVRGMEAEFLTTSDGLMRLAGQLGGIQTECQSLSDLTLGHNQDAAVQFAFQLLKKSEDLVLASYEQYDHVFATFSDLQHGLAQVSKQRDELMRILLPLNFISMAFRIEASRHPAEVQLAFFTLADNVNRTVAEVRRTMERQFEDLAASERIARSLVEQISDSVQQHRQEVASTLAGSRRQLGALSEALRNSGAEATDLGKRNQAVTSLINGMVMAQQCQDITRQRIEHVGEALDQIIGHLADAEMAVPSAGCAARQFVFQAAQIQLQQVQQVFGQLNHAAGVLTSGVQSLRTEAAAAAELAVKVGGDTLDAKVASQCLTGIGEILGIVRQAVQKIADIVAAFAPLQASFVDCTGKATTLAGDVRRAGLNAQVFAIHTADGATLEVLAGRVHLISAEVIQLVERMGTALDLTSEKVNNLRQRLEDFQVLCQAEQEVLAAESALSQEKLAALEAAIPVRIQRITKHQGNFAASVEEVLAGIHFPATVAQVSARSIGFFQDLLAWAGAGGAGLPGDSAAAQKLDRLKSNYTMDAERHAHEAAMHPAPAPPSASAAESSIEMFDDFSSAETVSAGPPPGEIPLPGGISPKPSRIEPMIPGAPSCPDTATSCPSPGRAGQGDGGFSPHHIQVQGKRPADQPPPAKSADSHASPLAPAIPVTEKKPAAGGGLGDNVELF